MKKVLLTAIVLSGAFTTAVAQGISIGPRIGINIAKVVMTDGSAEAINPITGADIKDILNDNTKSRVGLQIGVAANFGITESFSVQPELLFSRQGSKIDYSETQIFTDPQTGEPIVFTVNSDAVLKTSYLQLPVLARYSFGSGAAKFFINAGPYASYWMSGNAEYDISGTGMVQGQQISMPIESGQYEITFNKAEEEIEFNRMEIGLVAGAGIGFAAGPGQITLDLRYNHGFSNLVKPESGDNTKIVNRFFGVGINYMFGLGE